MSNLPTVDEYMKGRAETAAEIMAGMSNYEDDEAREEALIQADEFPLSVEIERHVVIVLGTGGPHDELDVTLDSAGGVSRVVFRYVWGQERGERQLWSGDALYQLAEYYADMFDGSDA